MGSAKQDINDFQRRVKQIKNPRNKSYYDPSLGIDIPKRVVIDRTKTVKEDPSPFSVFLVSMVLGAFALVCAQVLRIRYFGLTEPGGVVTALEIFVAFWAILIIAALLDKRTFFERFGQMTGIAAMMVAGHNLIWRWPEQMAYIYTSAHVEQVLNTTTQHSIVYLGSVYGL